MPRTNSATTAKDTLVTIDELAAIFGVSRSTVKNWRTRGIIKPCVAIGSVVRFDLADCRREVESFGERKLEAGEI